MPESSSRGRRASLPTRMILRGRLGLPPPPRGGRGAYSFFFLYFVLFSFTFATVPRFFESNRMSALYLPVDTEADSIIYRLRAEDSDRDYPLVFAVKGSTGQNLIYLDTHECTPSADIYCDADVYLRMPVERGRLYAFNLSVSDGRGYRTEVTARIYPTEGRRATPISDIFLKYSPTVKIKEDLPPKAVISTMTVRKRRFATFGEFEVLGPASKTFRMTPANLVSQETINGTLVLEQRVDYEQANLHTFKVCLLQPYTVDEATDTRNIACVIVSVVVEDVQDEPPVFTKAPPVTRIPATAVQGDNVVQIEAKDGDRGIPRPIRYSILPASSLYTRYFKMNPITGMLSMNDTAIALRNKMVSLDPILMTVTAEEVTTSLEYSALSSSVEIAFVVLDAEFLIPKFVHENYVGEVFEDSLPDTEVQFNSPFLVQGVKGLFALELTGDKGAFSVQPGVVTDAGEIKIKVRNTFLVDYEKSPQMSFKLIARQMSGSRQATGTTDITVKISDANDNAPEFSQPQYEVSIYENITRGTSILRVYASDEDSGQFGLVRYTNIYGDMSEKLYLEPTTGLITCATDNHGFDREKAAELILTVEAKDNNGHGASANTATAKIIIRLKDINDEPPRFVDSIYKGVMAADRQRLKDPIIFRAVDADAERPNNEVIYEIVRSSYSDFFSIDRVSGRFDVNPNFFPRTRALTSQSQSRERRQIGDNDTVISLTVKATDRGNPPLSDFVDVKIFRQEYGERVIRFIYPKDDLYVRRNKKELELTLNALTGGSTEILDSKPLTSGIIPGYTGYSDDREKSQVIALVRFNMNTVIDVEQMLLRINSTKLKEMELASLQKQEVITGLEDSKTSLTIGLSFVAVFLCLMIIICILCFCVEGCPLYRSSKTGISDDGSEMVSYVRVEDTARYRGANNEDLSGTPSWWQWLPVCVRDIFLYCGYIPPLKKNSRLAWSADGERQMVGRINQPGDGVGLEKRNAMVQPLHHRQQQQHHSMMLEDVDPGRGPGGGPMMRQQQMMQDPNQPQGDPLRVYVLKDAMGVERAAESLREGATYLVEDVNDPNRNAYPNDVYNQGNGEFLRQHVSPRDAAFYSEDQRRVRRADVGPEGAVSLPDETRGGQRYVNGQMVAQNDGYNNYGPSSYPQTETYPRGEVARVHYNQKSRAGGGGETDKSFRGKRTSTAETSRIDRSTDPLDRNTKSARSSNIPGTYGYQHTKTSILRYESNKSKIEEEREEKLRQGHDPDDSCISHQGGAYILAADSRKGSVRDREGRSFSRLDGRRSQNQFSMPGDRPMERRGSLTNIETNLEKEAARRIQIRRNSAGGGVQEQINVKTVNKEVDYDADKDKTEEIEKRIQQRRTEASEALSEELYSQNKDNQNNSNLQSQQGQQFQEVQQLPQTQQPQPNQQYQQPQQNQQYQQPQQNQQYQQPQQNQQYQQPQQNQQYQQPQQNQQYQQPQQNQQYQQGQQTQYTQQIPHSQQLQQPMQPQQLPQPLQPQQLQQPLQPQQLQQPLQPQQLQQPQQQPQQPQQLQQLHQLQQSQLLQNSQLQQFQDSSVVDGGRPAAAVSTNEFSQAPLQGQQQHLPINIPNADPSNTASQNIVNTNGVNISKESVEKAIASALVDMAVNNYGKGENPNTNQTNNLNLPPNSNANFSTQGQTDTGAAIGVVDNSNANTRVITQGASNVSSSQDHNMNLSSINIKNLIGKSIASNQNETGTSPKVEDNKDATKTMEDDLEMEKSATIFEKDVKNDSSILNIPKDRRKRNKMLEKKSIFTIAYDGMKTDQLRPDSATSNT